MVSISSEEHCNEIEVQIDEVTQLTKKYKQKQTTAPSENDEIS